MDPYVASPSSFAALRISPAGSDARKTAQPQGDTLGIIVLEYTNPNTPLASFAAGTHSRTCTQSNAAGRHASAVIKAVEAECAGANRYIPSKAFDRLRQREWVKRSLQL